MILPEVDPQHPNAARIYDYLLGGKHNFAADREAAVAATAAQPGLPAAMRTNRDFLRRAVLFAAESGIDQFLDLGAGIPLGEMVHDVARAQRPGARVVYVDLEAGAVVHGRRLLGEDPLAAVLFADLTDAGAVLHSPPVSELLDLERPVCLLLVAVAHYIPDTERLGRALERYREALAPGSLLVVTHAAGEGDRQQADMVREVYHTTASPFLLRDRDEVRSFFGDWTLVEPGLTVAADWHPASAGQPAPPAESGGRQVLAGVARKPERA